MSNELIAILVTAAFQASCLLAAIVMLYKQSKILERIEGIDAATYLQGRSIESALRDLRTALGKL